MRAVNEVMLQLSKRAEQYDRSHLIASFVDVGALLSVLMNRDNQVIFGRRGTGKTHVLAYLSEQLKSKGDLVVQIDMRSVGSSGGIYADPTKPLSERATRLLIDVLQDVHRGLSDLVLKDQSLQYEELHPLLEKFADSTVTVRVEGTISEGSAAKAVGQDAFALNMGVDAIPKFSAESRLETERSVSQGRTGVEKITVIFGAVRQCLVDFVSALGSRRLWILLDEWSEVPLDLQPILADLLRRTVFPVSGVSVKIAAIEQRTNFRVHDSSSSSYVGIEIGADIAASVNLDEYMVFENNPQKAAAFFQELLYKHATALTDQVKAGWPTTAVRFVDELFTQKAAFEEFVRSSEGVPRDAINIIGLAAHASGDQRVSVKEIRQAARTWYHRSKEGAVQTKPDALNLLRWIIDDVIKERQAKAFLLRSGDKDELIDFLYDSRILHVIRYGVSAQDIPGQRFTVYNIDYGCYVDLLATKNAPKGLFEAESEAGIDYVTVPATDYRSIRRSILDLDGFYAALRSLNSVAEVCGSPG